jgi:hypothetical protein
MKRRHLILLFFFLVLAASSDAMERRYPPYPDVWGHDLMEDFNLESPTSLTETLMHNGDYLLEYPGIRANGNDKIKGYAFLFFFEKKKRFFEDGDAATKYSRSIGFEYNPIKPYITLRDKKVIDLNIKPYVIIKYNRTNSVHAFYARMTDESFKNSDYEVSPIGIATYCDAKQVCASRAYSLACRIIKLKDDTFFLFNPDYYLFLRFDRNFKTKFKPQHTVKLDNNRELKSNFYVLPYSKVNYFFEHVATGYTGQYDEDINRQFLDYLYQEEQKGSLYVTP